METNAILVEAKEMSLKWRVGVIVMFALHELHEAAIHHFITDKLWQRVQLHKHSNVSRCLTNLTAADLIGRLECERGSFNSRDESQPKVSSEKTSNEWIQ